MKNNFKSEAAALRQKAEELLKAKLSESNSSLLAGEVHKLMHELEVHQIELKLQNEELIQANESAEIASAKYIELYDFAPTGYFTLSPKGEILELNLSGAKMLGKSRGNLKNRLMQLYVSFASNPVFTDFLEKTFATKTKQTCQVAFSTSRNTPLYVYLSGIINESGEQCYVTAIDITEQKKAEESLIESNELNHTLLNTIPFGMDIVDENGNILYLSDSFKNLFGEAALNKKCWEVYRDDKKQCPDCSLNAGIEIGLTRSNESHGVLDGRIFEISHTGMMFRGRKAMLEIFIDITERKKTELSLLASEKKYQSIFENVQDVFYQTDLAGYVLEISPSIKHFSEFDRDEIIGSPVFSLYYNPSDREVLLSELMAKGELRDYEIRLKTKTGKIKYVSLNATLIYDDAKPHHIDGALRDITERKLAENEVLKLNEELEEHVIERTSQLVAANIELEKFSYTASHDLRTPLRAINGYASILLEDYTGSLNTEAVGMLHVIQDNAVKMGKLIDDLMMYSKIGHTEMSFSQIDMYGMAETIFNSYTTQQEKENIDFRLQNIPGAYGDPSLMQQVFGNLISNAVKYTSKKAKRIIEISHKYEGNESIYMVKDNGAGFNMDMYSKLFGVFQRLHSTKEFEGSGMGLAIVQRIIKSHKGRVWGEGKTGEGASFYFALPVDISISK